MTVYEGACAICTTVALSARQDPRVRLVAEANWVRISFCSACGAYWDEQPASRPAVISRAEAERRVPDAHGWRVLGPKLAPADPTGLLIDVQRLDAHPGDSIDLHGQAELPGGATLDDVRIQVLEPFLLAAPAALWLCRAKVDGRWDTVATVSTQGDRGGCVTELLVSADTQARAWAGQAVLEIACRPSTGP